MGKHFGAFLAIWLTWTIHVSAESITDWLVVPPERSALLVQINNMQGRTLSVLGGQGETLDHAKWASSLPFVQQYFLPAGEYELRLPTADPSTDAIKISLKPGSFTFLSIAPALDGKAPMVEATNWYGQTASSALAGGPALKLEEIRRLGYDPRELRPPIEINPKGDTILFNTEPPFEIPKPPPPK